MKLRILWESTSRRLFCFRYRFLGSPMFWWCQLVKITALLKTKKFKENTFYFLFISMLTNSKIKYLRFKIKVIEGAYSAQKIENTWTQVYKYTLWWFNKIYMNEYCFLVISREFPRRVDRNIIVSECFVYRVSAAVNAGVIARDLHWNDYCCRCLPLVLSRRAAAWTPWYWPGFVFLFVSTF